MFVGGRRESRSFESEKKTKVEAGETAICCAVEGEGVVFRAKAKATKDVFFLSLVGGKMIRSLHNFHTDT